MSVGTVACSNANRGTFHCLRHLGSQFGRPVITVELDGERYDPVNTEGNSTFLIPLSGMDVQMPVTADTVAMSTPHEIDYTILVDSSTLREAE